jgi:hypothetical protein
LNERLNYAFGQHYKGNKPLSEIKFSLKNFFFVT